MLNAAINPPNKAICGPATAKPQKPESAHHRRGENPKRNRGSKLEKRAHQNGMGVALKIGNNGVGRFPVTPEIGPHRCARSDQMFRWAKRNNEIEAEVKQERVNKGESSGIRSPVLRSIGNIRFHESFM